MNYRRNFDARSWQRGTALQKSGAVIDIDYDEDDDALFSFVQGTASKPYAVRIFFEGDSRVESHCSCPVGNQCKHAVAALLEFTDFDPKEFSSGAPKNDLHTLESQAFQSWLARFSATFHAHDADFIEATATHYNDRIRLYSLTGDHPLIAGKLSVGAHLSLLDAQIHANGKLSRGRRHRSNDYFSSADAALTAMDKEVESLANALHQSKHGRWTTGSGQYALQQRLGFTLLDVAIDTGRCFIDKDRTLPVVQGLPRDLTFHWQELDEGHRLESSLDGLTEAWIVPTDPPLWINPHAEPQPEVGLVRTELSGQAVAAALEAPLMPNEQIDELADALDGLQITRPAKPLLLPIPDVPRAALIEQAPTPIIVLQSADDQPFVDSWFVALHMRYASVVLPCHLPSFSREDVERVIDAEGKPVRVQRDLDAEYRYWSEFLMAYPDFYSSKGRTQDLLAEFKASGESKEERFAHYRALVRDKTKLEQEGWEFSVIPPVHAEAKKLNQFDGLIQKSLDGPGWFDVSLGIEVEGVRLDLATLVESYLLRGEGNESLLIEQANGTFIEVPAQVLQPVAQLYEEWGQSPADDGVIRLSRAQALSLDRLNTELENYEGLELNWRGSREPFELADRLRAFMHDNQSTISKDIKPPRGLRAEMRPYQLAGLAWLNTLARHELCGILADDMGLGKTLQTIAHILWLRQSRRLAGPVLVVAPTSLLGNWAREISRFAPRLTVRVWHGADRHEWPLNDPSMSADVVVTSYGLARRDRDILAEHSFDFLVLDEAQQIRNAQASTTRAIKSLPIERRLSISGTPLENHLGELWSQFDFLMPGLLRDATRFNRHFRVPIEKQGDTEKRARLAAAISPFVLRRRKEMVAKDLPAKTDILRDVHFDKAQSELYETIRVTMQDRVRKALQAKGVAQSHVTVLDALLKLRQLCCHPELVKLPSAKKVKTSAKTTALLDMLDELIAEGRRVLVFSSFTSMLSIIERELEARNHQWVKLTGSTRKRDEAIDAFQNGDVPLFLISLKAGGTGLNLTAADTVIHYDPWWNPAAEEQASARAHRIGQNKPVFVYRLVVADTVEQRILGLQESKRELATAMVDAHSGVNNSEETDANANQGGLAQLTAAETLSLFDE